MTQFFSTSLSEDTTQFDMDFGEGTGFDMSFADQDGFATSFDQTEDIQTSIEELTPVMVNDHRELNYREAEFQHPIEAITNLDSELDARPHEALTNMDIAEVLHLI